MSERTKTEFIILHETVLQSLARDATSFALFAGLIGVGVAVGSSAMQWAGFFVAMVVIVGRVGSMKAKRMSRSEAIAYLQEREAAQ